VRFLRKKPARPECRKCHFFASNLSHEVKDFYNGDVEGLCMRYPPSIHMHGAGMSVLNPSVPPQNWCGEFKLRDPSDDQ
jgi:hypothetical protein